jgi:hypothetical protein
LASPITSKGKFGSRKRAVRHAAPPIQATQSRYAARRRSTTANQERELRQVAERAGWQIVHVYKDHGISGAKGQDKRPQFDALRRRAGHGG